MLYRLISSHPAHHRETVLAAARERFLRGEKLLVLVPEQITAEYERAILETLGAKSNLLVEVSNFSRLSNVVLRQTGGLCHRAASDHEKKLLISYLLRQENSPFPDNLSTDPDQVTALYEEMEELRLAGALGEEAATVLAEGGAPASLQDKLGRFGTLLAAASLLLEQRFGKCTDELEYLLAEPMRLAFFRDTTVLVDGFWDFTYPQEKLLCRLMELCPDLYVSFTARAGEEALFAAPLAAARRLLRHAQAHGIAVRDVKDEKREEESHRDFAAASLFCAALPKNEPVEGIRVVSCATAEEECAFLCHEIRRLLARGLRRSDVAVLSRNGALSRPLRQMLEAKGIPAFCEEKEPLRACPAARTVLYACRIATGDTREGTVRAFLKHGLLSHREEDVLLLEKYAATWSPAGRTWLGEEPFVMNPSGYGLMREADRVELLAVNRAKEAIFTPLRHLATALSAGSVREKVAAVVACLTHLGTEEVLAATAEEAKAAGDYDRAGRLVRSWNATLEALSELSAALGETDCDGAEFLSYLTLTLDRELPGAIPPGQDRVQIGLLGLHRARPRVLFVPDMNAGVFPACGEKMGVIDREERDYLEKMGYATAGSELDRARENFLFYLALKIPTEDLILSYVTEAPTEGDRGVASVFLGRLKALLPKLPTERFESAVALPATKEELLRLWAKQKEKETPFCREMEDYLAADGAFADRLAQTAAALAHRQRDFVLETEAPYRGENVNMTYSRFDTYGKCRFSFFAKYLLEAKESERAAFGANVAGSFVHFVLETVLSSVSARGLRLCDLSREELAAEGKKACAAALERYAENVTGARVEYLASLLERSCLALLTYLAAESRETQFRPIFFEKGLDELAGQYAIDLPDGTKLCLYGEIDRVDFYEKKDGTPFVRVVDYKTGGQDFSLVNVANGLNVQMLLYLFALWQEGFEWDGRTVRPLPAGILYLNGMEASVRAESREAVEKAQTNPLEGLKTEGLLLDDDELLLAQDPSAEGKFIPVRRGSAVSAKSLITLERLGRLKKKVERDFAALAFDLKQGRVEAAPLKDGRKIDACHWCKMRPICVNGRCRERAFRFAVSEAELFGEEEENG